jgi:hypothetical protein
MNTTQKRIANSGEGAEPSQHGRSLRRMLLGALAAAVMLMAAPSAANAVEWVSATNANNPASLNGGTVNFGTNTQLGLPVTRTIFFGTNTSGSNRRVGVNLNLTGSAYEIVSVANQNVAGGASTCTLRTGSPALPGTTADVIAFNPTSTTTFRSCVITLRLKAGVADNTTHNSTLTFSELSTATTGCSGANCTAWGGGTRPGSATLTGVVVANVNSGVIQDTAGSTALPSYDYGSRGIGTSTPYTFTLRNTGNTILTNTNSQTVTGVDAGDFIRSSSCPASLNPNQTCTIQVNFDPTAGGPRAATLTVNTGNAGPVSTNLQGIGLVPTFIPKLQDTAGAVDLPNYTFSGTVGVGEPFVPSYTFTLRNEGNAILTGTNIQSITGPDADDFTRSSACPASLGPNGTCQITITFNPNDPGAKVAALEVATANGGTATVNLDANAAAGVFQTTIQNTAGDTDLPSYQFPDTIGLGNSQYVFTVRNTGNVNLQNVGTQTITGTDADQFSRVTSCGAVLAPNGTCTVTVGFNPTRVQVGMSASLNISPSNGGASSIPLTATSLTPQPAVTIQDTGGTTTLTSRAYVANIGASQAYVFTLRNTGDSNLNNVAANQSITGRNAGEFSRTTTCGATLAPNATCTVTVTFNATRGGTRLATLNVSPTNALVAPAAKSVQLVGEATGVSIRNDVTDNIANTGSQKRWLDSVSLAPGGTIASDTVRVAFEVDAGTATNIAGVDILGNLTTSDTVPTGTFQNIADLTLGRVNVQRKPGSNQALITAQVPLSSTNMGVANGSFGFSTGTDIIIACLGGSFENTNRRVWFRVRGADGSTSATVGSVVRLHNQQFACPNNQGPNLSNQRILEIDGASQPSGVTEAEVLKGQPVTFQFNTRAKAAPALGGNPGFVDGVNWRIRNAKTGDMFRLVGSTYQPCADPCTADSNFTVGTGRINFASNLAGVQTLDIPGIPSRGRWIVEASPQGSDENNDSFFFLGALNINDQSGTSPTLNFGGSLGARPDSNANYTISASVADPADPSSAFDTQGGRAQVIEWDLDGNTTNGPGGDGFEVRGESDSSGALTADDLVQAFSTVGKTPGPYTIRARVTDNGAQMAADNAAVQRIFTFNTTINSPPVGTTETIFLEADDSQPQSIEFRATDADNDPYRVNITPDGGNDGTLGGNLNDGIGQNTKPYDWPASYTGTDTFSFVTTDDKNGIAAPATLTIKVRPNTTLDDSVIPGALLNPDLADPNKRFLGSTTATDAEFDFSSPQTPVNAYECRLLNDNVVIEDWASCAASPTGTINYTGLDDGLHRFEVRAVNDDGDKDGTPAFRTWRVDNTVPTTEIRIAPVSDLPNQQPRLTNDTTPTYIFRATAAERSLQQYVTYECRVLFGPESGTWQACGAPSDQDGSGPVDIVGPNPDFGITDPLAEGTYSIEVRATDEVGNLGPVYLETFTVDTSPPVTALASGAEGLVNTRDLEYVLSSSEGQSTFTCLLERRDPGPSLTTIIPMGPCPGPASDGSRPTFSVPTDGEYILTAIATDPATNPDPTPLVVEFEVDATEPTTSLDPLVDYGEGPSSLRRTQSRKIDLTFTGADTRQLSGFQCRLDSTDDLDWTLCQSVQRFGGLSDGAHKVEIRSRDEASNFDSSPEVIEWIVDRTPPVTTIDVAPDPVDNDASPTVEFSVNETATSICSFDSQPWVACSSPVSVASLNGGNPLSQGPHTLAIRSTDLAGNDEATNALASWSTDTVDPVVEFTSKPGAFVPQGDVDFGWSVKDGSPAVEAPEVQAECSYDNATFTACDRMITLPEPSNGAHTFVVRAIDQAGNISAEALHAFEILGEPPVVPVINNSDPVAGSTTRIGNARIAFSHPDEALGSFAGFECRLDGVSWIPCSSPFEADGLGDGAHIFEVRARDVADNIGPAVSMNWEVQAGAPVTTIDSGPSGTTSSTSAALAFSSDKDGTFECRIDGAAWATCESPLELSDLSEGEHSVSVRAVSGVVPVGVKDPTPPARQWTVDSTPPDIEIDSAPTGTVISSTAQVTFSSTEDGASFQCKLGTGLFDACDSPLNLTGLAAGEVTLAVRAVDAAGNVSAPAAQTTWTVEDPTCPDGFEGTPPDCTELPPVEGPGLRADLTGGELSLASLGAVPLPADQVSLEGVRASDGRWFVAAAGVQFEPVVQTIPDVLGPGTNVDVTISISATGAGRGTLPTGGGPATFKLPVRADVQAKLGTINVIPPGTECSLRPITFDLTGTYDEAAKTVSLTSPTISFPKVTGCATFKETIDSLLELPRSDIEMSLDFALSDVASQCPDGQVGSPPNCVPAQAVLAQPRVKAPKTIKSGKPVTIAASVRNSGNSSASNVKVCLSMKKAARLVRGKAKRCKTISSIAAGKSSTARFKVKTKPIRTARARLNYSVSASASGTASPRSRTGHVSLLK